MLTGDQVGGAGHAFGLANGSTSDLGPVDALSTLLTTESLLLAVVGVAVTLATPGQVRNPRLPVRPGVLAGIAVGVLSLVGVGAVFAWGQIYLGGALRPLPDLVIAVALLVAIVAEPVLAVLLALGIRKRRAS